MSLNTGDLLALACIVNCAGLHNLFAKGFKAGRHQGLGPATENFSQQEEIF